MILDKLKRQFIKEYGKNNQVICCFFAPGRVNLIGEHIDYNGGYVFPTTLSLGIYGALRLRSDNLIQMKSTNASPPLTVDLQKPISFSEQDGWGNYPKGIIKFLLKKNYPLKGCDILFSGNLPDGAGLSSSAAILVLTAFMLKSAAGETKIDRPQLARFCQQVENQFIGVNCGIMDQFSVANGRKDYAILLDCETMEYKYVPFVLRKHSLVIMNTNKKRGLADSKYNQRRSECEQALGLIRRHLPINNLCQASAADVDAYLTDDVLRRRVKHVITENKRVLQAVRLLEQDDIAGFGKLMTESHYSLQKDYEVTGPELDSIVDNALKAANCIGARMTGAGFGGCAIALVERSSLEKFKAAVTKGYKDSTGLTPDFYVTGIADAVKALEC